MHRKGYSEIKKIRKSRFYNKKILYNKKNKKMKNSTFWNLGILVMGIVNYIFEVKKDLINLEVGEICIIVILLSVIIFIINEINTFLKENIELKYQAVIGSNYKTNSYLDNSKIKTSTTNLNLLGKVHIINLKKYKTYLTFLN